MGVNDNGLVVGDTSSLPHGRQQPIGKATRWPISPAGTTPGRQPQPYAPTGVKFNIAQAVNDAGQILVWSGGYQEPSDGPQSASYLLTPVATPEPSMLLLMASARDGSAGLRLAEAKVIDEKLPKRIGPSGRPFHRRPDGPEGDPRNLTTATFFPMKEKRRC